MQTVGGSTTHQVPVFAILLHAGVFLTGLHIHILASFDLVDGENVPKVFREHVGNEKIDFFRVVTIFVTIVSCNAVVVPIRWFAQDGLDLDAPESFLKADDYIVAVAVAPRLGDGESEVCGFAHEDKLGEFAAALRVEFGCVSQFIG